MSEWMHSCSDTLTSNTRKSSLLCIYMLYYYIIIFLGGESDDQFSLLSFRDSVDAGSAVKAFPGTHDKLGSYAARFVFLRE